MDPTINGLMPLSIPTGNKQIAFMKMGVERNITQGENEYNQLWYKFLGGNPSIQEILEYGRQLSKDYGIKTNY